MINAKSQADASSVQIGTRIGGRFSVQALLGSGGMADVYRVRDEAAGDELALKRLRRSAGRDLRAVALFEREYHTLAQITHPCVVSVCDYGVDPHGAFYTMELVRGEDLRTRGKLEWREACRVLRDVASALAALHARRWLHRDLSPRNVMCTASGVAKLIDFGAMAPMGVAREIVGTPPLVSPEIIAQQNLDARADLYALGALAYWVLTGRHAYPARDFDELRDRWRSVPQPIAKHASAVPEALSRLVFELLSLDRNARPGSASEVIERLTSMLGDGAEVQANDGVAYLTAPRLVGRDQALQGARALLVSALRGRGAALLIEGDAGSGKSRFLDACVLEAKLLGSVVLRGDASDGARGDYGLAAAVGEQLLRTLPEQAVESARLRSELLGVVIPELASGSRAHTVKQDSPAHERRHVQAALRDWLLSIARSRRIVIAVDDFDRIDEPSAAWLASLAHRSQRRKLVVVATSTRAAAQPALELLRAASAHIELDALSQAQTEALLVSLFGEARSIAPIAQRVYETARGNPRQTMELAEHLVRRGFARYTGGVWVLPSELGPDELPASIEAALGLRLAELGTDARELAETLALTDPQVLSLESYPVLLGTGDAARAYRALDVLVAAGILQAEGDRYRFVHQRAQDLLASDLDAERRSMLHARLASAVDPARAPLRLAHHLLHSGAERSAVELLLGRRGQIPGDQTEPVALLEHAVRAAEVLDFPLRSQLELRTWLTVISGPLGRLDVFLRHAPDLLKELERASGLAAYRELGDALAPDRRLHQALTAAQAHYESLPELRRPWPLIDAIRELGRMVATYSAVSAMAFDLELVESVPSLEPLIPLSPALAVVQMLVDSIRHHQAGRFSHARMLQNAILERIEQADRAGLDAITYDRMRCGILYSVGILEAMSGRSAALERVAELHEQPGYRANAWRVHAIFHFMQGDIEEAKRSERRGELMQLQDGGGQIFPGTGFYSLAIVHWLADDLDGLKQFIDPMRAMAERFPKWRVPYRLAEAHYLRLKGDFQGALAIVEPLREDAAVGRPHGLRLGGLYVRDAALRARSRRGGGGMGNRIPRCLSRAGLQPGRLCDRGARYGGGARDGRAL